MATSIKRPMKDILSRDLFTKQRTKKEEIKFIKMLGELLEEGHTLNQALDYLEILLENKDQWIGRFRESLLSGTSLDQAMKEAGFPEWISSQVYMANHHGQLAKSLIACANQYQHEQNKRKELINLLIYPSFLLAFVLGIFMAMRFILLPQLMANLEGELSISLKLLLYLIYYLPQILMVAGLLVMLAFLAYRHYFKARGMVERLSFLMKLPLIKQFLSLFYSYRFSLEWSALMKSGLQMKEIVRLMQDSGTTQLMREIGFILEEAYLSGEKLEDCLSEFSFFQDEFPLIVSHGSRTGKLDHNLDLYSSQCFQELNYKLQKVFQFIQPVIFIVIAVTIVGIYAAMLMPMFSMMDQL